jgi:hypothetical protein
MKLKLPRYRQLAACLVASCIVFVASPSRAALPDPVRFGVAIELGNVSAARAWLDAGLDPNFAADRVGTGIMLGAWEDNIAMMELFLQRGADINFTNATGEQALQLAAWKGHADAVRWLIAHGAAINRQGREWSALHYAVFAGHKDVVAALMEHGADVNARVPNGSTVLMMAAREGREDLAKVLINAGADMQPTNERGESALTWAMRHKNFRIANLVASKAEFAEAAKAPPERFGTPIRSTPAPIQISDLLRQVRQAEAEGRPADELRLAFLKAVEAFKRDSRPLAEPDGTGSRSSRAAGGSSPKPSALVITAKRSQVGSERAELTYGKPNEVSTLLLQLRQARAQGHPTEDISKALLDAVTRRSGQP